jgi:predicted nuclease of predicted toxin-antitoxin system
MKILLDESLPLKLKLDFPSVFNVFTVRDMGWLGIKNGELLRRTSVARFDVFITVDRQLPRQQNLSFLTFRVLVMVAYDNRLQTLRKLMPAVLNALQRPYAGQLLIVSQPDPGEQSQ